MYPLLGKPHLGKVDLTPQVNLGLNTALELCALFLGTGKNLTCDNFFADKELCKQMSTNKMTEKKQNIHTDRVSGRQSEH